MKKLTVLLLVFGMYVTPVFSQKPKAAAPVPPKPAAPKPPPPYVLKKDYEAKMEELTAKINSASSAASSARSSVNSMENRLGQVAQLDSQLLQVQEIVNMASSDIAMNADSLRETRALVDNLSKKTDDSLSAINEHNEGTSMMMWILFGASVAVSVGVLLFLLSALQKRMKAIEDMLRKNEEVLKKSLSNQVEKMQSQLNTEMQASESRILTDMTILKRELTVEKDRSATAFSELRAKVDSLNPSTDGGVNDADTFI